MSGWDALAATGSVLLFVAIALAITAFGTFSERDERRYARLGWAVFTIACSCLIGSFWWAAA